MNGHAPAPPRHHPLGRWVRHHLGWTLALVVLLLAVGAALARLLLPGLDYYREDVQAWVGTLLGAPVTIAGLGAEWYGWAPVLRVEGLHLIGPAGDPVLRFDAMLVRLDPLASLRQGRPVPDHLVVRGAHLQVTRTREGGLELCCLPAADDAGTGGQALDWVLRERRLELVESSLTVRDEARGGATFTVTDIALGLWNTATGHRLRGAGRLPPGLGGRFTLAADLDGLPAGGEWAGDLHLTATGVQLGTPPLTSRYPPWLSVGGGSADVSLWARWEAGRLADAQAELDVHGVAAAAHGHAFPITHLDADVRYVREGEVWSVVASAGAIRSNDTPWATRTAVLRVAGSGSQVDSVLATVDVLPVDLLRAYVQPLGPREDLANWLMAAAPVGVVRDLAVRWQPQRPLAAALDLRAAFADLGFMRQGAVPGVTNLAGRVTVQGGEFTLELEPREVVVDATPLFRNPLTAHLDGTLRGRKATQGWALELDPVQIRNSDLRLDLAGTVTLPEHGGAPHLNLVGQFGDARVENISTYLPVAVMAPDAVRWLDRGLVGGRLEQGGLVIHGPADGFPFDGGTGRFEVRAQFSDALIDYKSGWPRLEEVHGEILFLGRSMTVNGQGGKLLESEVGPTIAYVPDLDAEDVRLDIRGTVRGPGQDGMRVLLETPLRERFEAHLAGSTISGPVDITLDLSFLLDSDGVSLNGDVAFSENDLDLALLGVRLEDTRGTLHLTDESLSGQGLQGRLLGLAIGLDVETLRADGDVRSRLHLHGHATPQDLTRIAGTGALPRLSGRFPWRATVDIPATIAGQEQTTALALASDLRGLAVDLPQPLGKAAAESRELVVNTVVGSVSEQALSFRYGDQLRGRLSLAPGPRLERGVLLLGEASGDLPAAPGLLVRGRLGPLRLAPWLRVLADLQERHGAPTQGPDRGLTVVGIDLETRRLDAFGQVFADLRATAGPKGDGPWVLTLASPQLGGTVELPAAGSGQPLAVRLDRLHLAGAGATSAPGDAREEPDPRRIPALDFVCTQLQLDDLDLGEVRFSARNHVNGIELTTLTARGERLEVDGSGDWLARGERQVTHLKAQMKSPDLGALLDALGFSRSGVAGGATRARLEAGWEGGPEAFALERINGELELDIEDGRLVDVDPGASGRVFGLLSVTALPRRLKLDFSDLFTKGLSFDTIEGTFTIDNGDAYTNNLTMSSPSAQVAVAGRVGLASEDYDQLVTVTPRVSATLPLAGAIAGGPVGAAVGAAAAFVAEKLFDRDMGRVIQTQYTIRGPWSDPVVQELQSEEPEAGDGPGETEEFSF